MWVRVMFIVEDHTVMVKCTTAIKSTVPLHPYPFFAEILTKLTYDALVLS